MATSLAPMGASTGSNSLRQADEEYAFQYFYSGINDCSMGRGTYEAFLKRWRPMALPRQTLRGADSPRPAARRRRNPADPLHACSSRGGIERSRLPARIWLVGGSLLAGNCYTAGLIDEVVINLVPHLLGAGSRCWPRAWNAA